MNPTHKAILIAKTIYEKFSGDVYSDCMESAVQMHDWSKQQFIKFAIEWLSLNAELYGGFNHNQLNVMIKKFKNDAEEQL